MSNNIISIVSSYIDLKKGGRNKKCLCPFHNEKTPSFTVYEDTQSFYCFGCGAGGDVISFIMQIENLDYIEAIRLLANRSGITIPEDGQDDQLARRKELIYKINKDAAKFFHNCLKSTNGKAGLQYFVNRKLKKTTIIKYGLGFAPDSWHGLLNYLNKLGYSSEDISDADLAIKSPKGNYYDKFRNRVIFPIIDLRGTIIGFGGRVLDDSKPKYLNSSDTVIFKKSNNLFSMNLAKNSADKSLILSEGYMDVIAMYQAGFQNAVATLGTALTTEQARLISRYANDVVIAYDSDEAGQNATNRASKLFEEVGVEARVLQIKNAKDPDEYIQEFGADRFKVLIEQSENVIVNRIKRIKAKHNLDEPDELVKYINECCQIISELEDESETEVYIGNLSNESKISKEILVEKVKKMRKNRYKRFKTQEWKEIQSAKVKYLDKINPESAKYPKEEKAEEGILYFLLNHPDYVTYILEEINSQDFVTSFNKKLFVLIVPKIIDGTFEIGVYNSILSREEIGRLTKISVQKDINNSRQALDDYIKVLKDFKNKLQDSQRHSISLEDYEKRRIDFKKEKE